AGGVGTYSVLTPRQRRIVRVTFEGIYRGYKTFAIGLAITTDYKWTLFGLNEESIEYESLIKECHRRSARRIASGCIDNGGLYVKMGQGLVTMDHALPKEYCNELKILHDKALRRRRNEVESLLHEEFQCGSKDLFSYISKEPIAAASLAEVYEGQLKTGEKVAIKYIDLQDRFQGDMLTIKLVLKAIGYLFPKFEFEWIIGSIKTNLERELNFICEGENAEQCYRQLKELKFVFVPKIYWHLTSRRVLTMEMIYGCKINDVEGIKQMGLSMKEVRRRKKI
ncbi:unnamed protein product, partial [Didymodactylos carnosus]